jgi:hypothetical protein
MVCQVFLQYNFTMKKWLIIIGAPIIVATVIGVSIYDQVHYAQKKGYTVNCTHPSEPSAAADSLICVADNHQEYDGGKPYPPPWNDVLAWPEGVTALLLALTLAGIASQAWETRKAAEATERSATAQMDADRSWVLVEIGEIPDFQPIPNQLEILWIRPAIKNVGSTVARIQKIRAVIRLNKEGEALPQIPEYPLGQGADITGINILLPPNTPVQPIKLGITGDEFTQAKEGKQHLYLHGFIEYLDLGNTPRRTAFCYYYAVQGGFSPDPTRFYLELTAPAAYNDYT